MNGRKARFAQCPICQERFCVCRWYPLDEQVFYSTIVCPEHGRFPVRLTVTHRTDGQWHGRSTVPVLTDIQRELFQQAKANEPIRILLEIRPFVVAYRGEQISGKLVLSAQDLY